MKVKITVTNTWRTGNPLSQKFDPGELKEEVNTYILEPGMEISVKKFADYEFKINNIEEDGKVSIVCNRNFSEVSEKDTISLYSTQKELILNVFEDKKIAPAVTDVSIGWKFKIEELIN